MPQSNHDRVAELHNLTTHAHDAAAVSKDKSEHLSAHEQTTREQEQNHAPAADAAGTHNLKHGKAASLEAQAKAEASQKEK